MAKMILNSVKDVKDFIADQKTQPLENRYRLDEHLHFLKEATNDELGVLFKILTEGKDGERRISEDLTRSVLVKRHHPDHKNYWDLIAAEYQLFGGNSFTNTIRQKGLLYRDILLDVAKQMKVNFPKDASVEVIERNLLSKVLEESIENMSEQDRMKLLVELDIKTNSFSKQATLFAIQTALKTGFGQKIMATSFLIAQNIATAVVGQGVTVLATSVANRAVTTLTGPVGWFLLSAWTVYDLLGPAYRVTIPATIYIASLRQYKLAGDLMVKCKECGEFIDINSKFCSHCGAKTDGWSKNRWLV
jgi:uncharacterized protein YaaW (UPF0174 family)